MPKNQRNELLNSKSITRAKKKLICFIKISIKTTIILFSKYLSFVLLIIYYSLSFSCPNK